MAVIPGSVIAGDAVLIVPGADSGIFAVLQSAMHMEWVRTVAGRLKSDFRYSASVVYNNYPFPQKERSEWQRAEAAAEHLLSLRNNYPELTPARLYAEEDMPPEYREAHRELDAAVDDLYGYTGETDRISFLFGLFAGLTRNTEKKDS